MKSILALVLAHAVKCSSDDVQTMYRIGCPNLIYVESGHNPITFALPLAYREGIAYQMKVDVTLP
jgi:hypothetical protein